MTERINRHYPKAAYAWLLFRRDFLGKQSTWPKVKERLLAMRYSSLPKRFQEKGHWNWFKFWMKRYSQLQSFRFASVKDMGLGVFAERDMKRGSTLLFGHLHRVSHKTVLAFDKMGESSLMQVARGGEKRIDWYYLGGPASLVNHSCKRFNAEFVLDHDDRRGANGEMLVRLLRNVSRGEEILANYGEEFWKGKVCKCADCCRKCEASPKVGQTCQKDASCSFMNN